MIMASNGVGGFPGGPPVAEKTFDEYHLYTLQRPVTLHDKESKQVEFIRAAGVKSDVIYVYDGANLDANRYQGWQPEMIRNDSGYGTLSNPKVWVMREFVNSDANRKVRNHKKEPVNVRVVEHLYRWNTWTITSSSMPHSKTDAQTIEFRVPLQPDEEKTVTYTVHYTW